MNNVGLYGPSGGERVKVLLEQLITYTFSKIFTRQGIFLGKFLCDGVQDVEGFSTDPRHFPSKAPHGYQIGNVVEW